MKTVHRHPSYSQRLQRDSFFQKLSKVAGRILRSNVPMDHYCLSISESSDMASSGRIDLTGSSGGMKIKTGRWDKGLVIRVGDMRCQPSQQPFSLRKCPPSSRVQIDPLLPKGSIVFPKKRIFSEGRQEMVMVMSFFRLSCLYKSSIIIKPSVEAQAGSRETDVTHVRHLTIVAYIIP